MQDGKATEQAVFSPQALGAIDPSKVSSKQRQGYLRSPFAGTAYGLTPSGSPSSDQGAKTLALWGGVPETYVVNATMEAAQRYERILQMQEMEMQKKLFGTNASQHIEYQTTKVKVVQRNADGSIKMQHVAGPLGGVTTPRCT